MESYIDPKLFKKYKKVVNTYLLYNGNITQSEISVILHGETIYVIRAAIKHYLEYPDQYESVIINANPHGKNNEFYSKKHRDIVGIPEQDKVENGIKTMLFWREVHKELSILKERNGNYYARKHQSIQIIRAVSTVLEKGEYKKNKDNYNDYEGDNNSQGWRYSDEGKWNKKRIYRGLYFE